MLNVLDLSRLLFFTCYLGNNALAQELREACCRPSGWLLHTEKAVNGVKIGFFQRAFNGEERRRRNAREVYSSGNISRIIVILLKYSEAVLPAFQKKIRLASGHVRRL